MGRTNPLVATLQLAMAICKFTISIHKKITQYHSISKKSGQHWKNEPVWTEFSITLSLVHIQLWGDMVLKQPFLSQKKHEWHWWGLLLLPPTPALAMPVAACCRARHPPPSWPAPYVDRRPFPKVPRVAWPIPNLYLLRQLFVGCIPNFQKWGNSLLYWLRLRSFNFWNQFQTILSHKHSVKKFSCKVTKQTTLNATLETGTLR